MSSSEGVDGLLSAGEFLELIQHLSLEEMLRIEYRTATSKWKKLFFRNLTGSNLLACDICSANASSYNNLLDHINGRRHGQQMTMVENLYHPKYTYPKDDDDIVIIEQSDDKMTHVMGTSKTKDKTGDTKYKTPEKNVQADMTKYPEMKEKGESAKKTKRIDASSRNVRNSMTTPSNDEELEKPRYERDKIITPTVNKNKTAKETKSSSSHMDSPSFTSKTYSSKPGDDVYGILGVEYVIKLINKMKPSSPRYECGLCELVLDGFAMQKHLEGYNHRLKYCEKHFPTAIRHFRQYMHGVPEHEMFKVMSPILAKLAIAIEKYHGRNFPYECSESDFALHRQDILAKAYSCRHASEQHGPSFTHVVDSKEIDKYINERHNYSAPTFARNAVFDRKAGNIVDIGSTSQSNGRSSAARPTDRHRNVVERESNNKILVGKDTRPKMPQVNTFNAPTQYMPSIYPYQNVNRNEGMMTTPMISYPPQIVMEPYIPTPVANNYVSNNMMETFMPNPGYNYNMQPQPPPVNFSSSTYNDHAAGAGGGNTGEVDDQIYKNMVDEFLKGTLKGKHGNSSRKRSPHSSHSTVPPPKRTHQENFRKLNDNNSPSSAIEQEIVALDVQFRSYRKEPEKYPHYNDEWQKFWKRRKEELIASGKDHRGHNYQPEWIQYIKEHIERAYRLKLEAIKIKSQNHAGGNAKNANTNAPRDNTTTNNNRSDNKPKPEVDHSKAVSALRLMAALEENLGSLGPKIINLLSKALQLEKINRSDIVCSLFSNENCSIIETAKEKFKGLLLTNMVEGSKRRAMKKAVEEAEVLLTSTQHLRALNQTQKATSEQQQQRKPQTQSAPTIADILRALRAQSDREN